MLHLHHPEQRQQQKQQQQQQQQQPPARRGMHGVYMAVYERVLRIRANKPRLILDWIEPDYLHMRPQHVVNTRPVEVYQTPEAL